MVSTPARGCNRNRASVMNHAQAPDTLNCDLLIVAWNANDPQYRIEELQAFLVRHKPDIFLINETHLTPAKRVKIPQLRAA